MSYGTAETFFTAQELVLGEVAHGGVGVAEGVHLAEEVREAGRVGLTNLLKRVLVESRGRKRLARVPEGRKVLIARAVSGNHRTSSIPSSFRVPEGS
jgi:hypothetical protein